MRLGEDACCMPKQSPRTVTNTIFRSLLLVVSWMLLPASSAWSEGVAPLGPLLLQVSSSSMTINMRRPFSFERKTPKMVSEMVSEKVSAVFHYVFMFLKFAETLFCVSFGILFLYHFYIASASFWIPFRRSFGIPFWHPFGTSFRDAHNVSLDTLCRIFWIRFWL